MTSPEAKRFRERWSAARGHQSAARGRSLLLGATSPLLGATSPLLGAPSPLLGVDAVRLLGASDPSRGPGTGEGKSAQQQPVRPQQGPVHMFLEENLKSSPEGNICWGTFFVPREGDGTNLNYEHLVGLNIYFSSFIKKCYT